KFLPSSAAILFNYCHDGKWWLGWIEGSTSAGFSLQWRNVGGTTFGNLSDGNHLNLSGWFSYLKPTSASLLFNYVNDGNWWLGWLEGSDPRQTNIVWKNVGNTHGFGNLLDGRHYTLAADFNGDGRDEVLFYYANDGNWWLGWI